MDTQYEGESGLKDGASHRNVKRSPGRVHSGWIPCLLYVLALCVFFSDASASERIGDKPGWGSVAEPLRIVNLNPFHLLYGVPASFGAHVLKPGSSELIVSTDIASYLVWENSGSENIFLDGETYRFALALRGGFRDRWEWFAEAPIVAHRTGVFDSFIENWHDFFGLAQNDRDRVPHDRLALFYRDGAGAYVDIRENVSSFGDISLGVGYASPQWGFSNDGLAIRASVKLPTGDQDLLAGSGGLSASIWAETSGALPGSAESRRWLYAATLGALLAKAPRNLPGLGGEFIAFGRFGVTWRPLPRLTLTVQVDVHSSPYGSSGVSPLADPGVMLGFGGALKLTERATLEIAVTEDDGSRHAAPDIGLHVALRWKL